MLKIEFKTGNAAFNDPYTGEPDDINLRYESVRILKEVVAKIESGYTEGSCIDLNGNKVGTWKLN